MIPLKVGFPRKPKINILSFYRQWRIQETAQTETMSEVSNLVENQALRFRQIVDTWSTLIDENRETISLSDTNLHSTLLLEEDDVPRSEIKYRPVSTHFHQQILPRGVVILNNMSTHVSTTGSLSTIDHIMTTNPSKIIEVKTTNHGESDHSYLSCTRVTKSLVSKPRYRNVRKYNTIDPMVFQALL